MLKQRIIQNQSSGSEIPAGTKLVEEDEIDVENIQECLGHKLFCQSAIRGVVA